MSETASTSAPRLGVNIDHIATLRQLRGTPYPDVVEAAAICERAGAEQITIHLREDRRHINDTDVKKLRGSLRVAMNLEMAVSDEIIRIALRTRPDWACLVPEKRREVTTEGGLDVVKNKRKVGDTIRKLKQAGIRVSTFIEPSSEAVKISAELGADAVEFHTGKYCVLAQQADKAGKAGKARSEIERLRKAALLARKLGLGPHAGHGFDYVNVRAVAELTEVVVAGDDDSGDGGRRPLIDEYNIGHSIVCRAAIVGLEQAVREMVSAISAP